MFYRSPLHIFLNAGLALKTAVAGNAYRLRHWLFETARRGGADATSPLVGTVRWLKAIKASALRGLRKPSLPRK